MTMFENFVQKWWFLEFAACCTAAILLFHREWSRPMPIRAYLVPEVSSNTMYSRFDEPHEVTRIEERIVIDAMKEIRDFLMGGDILVELVSCNPITWFKTSPDAILTRSLRNFVQDDSSAHDVRIRRENRVVFLCYNGWHASDVNFRRAISKNAHSKLFHRPREATDLLIVITRNRFAAPNIVPQLPIFPSDFKEMIHVEVTTGEGRVNETIECTETSFVKLSFGFRMTFHTSKEVTRVTGCLRDWQSKVENKGCSRQRSKMQDIKSLELYIKKSSVLWFEMLNASKPCIGLGMQLRYDVQDVPDVAHLPFSIDNEVSAYAFDREAPNLEHQGLVLNESVIGIMVLLGTSIWLLSKTADTETLVTFLCAISRSGTCPDKIKGSVATAAYLWILGNTFFALLLVDDMTSMISVPGNSRIPILQDCVIQTLKNDTGGMYIAMPIIHMWHLIDWVVDNTEDPEMILCASRSEADEFNRYFGLENSYRIPLRGYGRRWMVQPNVVADIHCPWHVPRYTRCEIFNSFVDTAEWNEFAMIMLQYDLAKAVVQWQSRLGRLQGKAAIEKEHGCCRDRGYESERLLRFLSKFSRRQGPDTRRSEFPMAYLLIANSLAIVCFVAEIFLGLVTSIREKPRVQSIFQALRWSRKVKFEWVVRFPLDEEVTSEPACHH